MGSHDASMWVSNSITRASDTLTVIHPVLLNALGTYEIGEHTLKHGNGR